MKTIEELHAEALMNLSSLHDEYFHKDCLAICIALIVVSILIAFTF